MDSDKLEKLVLCSKLQHAKILEQQQLLADQGAKLTALENENDDLRQQLHANAVLRPSLEVLQRMANGLDPFDRGRFQCAVAALPHETPKLSATVAMVGSMGNIGDRLDRARRQQIEASGLRVVEGEGA